MFGLFGKSKEKAKAKKSAALREEALANMRGARERLGDATIQEMAAALRQQDESAMKKAENQIRQYDKGRIADNIKAMMDEK
ncbi:MAG: hypothetical protein ACK4NR_01420 [Micavibrio sp.]